MGGNRFNGRPTTRLSTQTSNVDTRECPVIGGHELCFTYRIFLKLHPGLNSSYPSYVDTTEILFGFTSFLWVFVYRLIKITYGQSSNLAWVLNLILQLFLHLLLLLCTILRVWQNIGFICLDSTFKVWFVLILLPNKFSTHFNARLKCLWAAIGCQKDCSWTKCFNAERIVKCYLFWENPTS